MKAILTKKKDRLIKERDDLKARALASTDVEEVRSLTAEIERRNTEIAECDEMIAYFEEQRSAEVPENATLVNGNTVGSFHTEERSADPTSTMEYRQAFMAYVQTGEVREAITTGETGTAVPMTIMNEVINTVKKAYGNLYSKTRKLNIKGGVQYNIGALKAQFKWINESTVSPRQDLGKLGKISFTYHEAEIRIAQSFLSSLVTISAFESEIARCIAIAYLEAMDYGIIHGTGDGQMTGILNDPRVTKTVEMTAADINDWQAWRKKFFATLPLKYRNGEFIFPVSTVDTYLETMSDANKNPIFRQATGLEVNDGDAANPNGRFFGRDISLVEPNIIADFDAANAGDTVGIFWQPDEYAINENFGFTMMRYFDHETNEWVDKAITVVDGKVLNPEGFVKIIKKAS